jgi:hypothetical protein
VFNSGWTRTVLSVVPGDRRAPVVVVTASSVRPVIPRTAVPGLVAPSPPVRVRLPLPLAGLGDAGPRTAGVGYAVSAVDKSGRVADRRVLRSLGWPPGTRLDGRVRDGVIVVRPAGDGGCRVDDRGFLVLPLPVRRWSRLERGDQLLLAANPAGEVLYGYPLALLDRLLEAVRPVADGGEPR